MKIFRRTSGLKQQVIDGRSTNCGFPHTIFILLYLNAVVRHCERLKNPGKKTSLQLINLTVNYKTLH